MFEEIAECFACGGDRLVPVFRPERLSYDNYEFVAQIPAIECRNCGKFLLDGMTMQRFEGSAGKALARAGVFSPKALGLMLLILELDPSWAAALLGVSEPTLSAWMNGKERISPSASRLLALMVLDGDTGEALGVKSSIERLLNPPALDSTTKISL